VRFLVDQNLKIEVAERLATAGHTAILPSLILLRRQHHRRSGELVALILANLPDVEESLDLGAVVVFDEARVRVRPLPFRAM
jgi:hypothetical protein